jgi:hypothetical protein
MEEGDEERMVNRHMGTLWIGGLTFNVLQHNTITMIDNNSLFQNS